MSKPKTKITDADIIDVVINDRMNQLKQKRAAAEAKLEHLQMRYERALRGVVLTSPRGRALLKLFPEAKATSIHSWRGNRVTVSFNRHEDNNKDELSAEIVVKPAAAKRVSGIKSDIDKLKNELHESRTPERIAWKRAILREVLAEQPAALAAFRASLTKAVNAAYKTIPEHRHRRLANASGIAQPKKPAPSRKG